MALIKCSLNPSPTPLDTSTIKVMISGPSASVQDNRIQFQVYLQPIPTSTPNTGIDATVNFMSKDPTFDQKDVFYTDSNSLEFMKRTTVLSPPSAIVQTTPSNYYPITSGIWIEVGQQQMIVMPSYSAGGSG